MTCLVSKEEVEKETDQKKSGQSGYSHLKWPAIIFAILIIILIVVLDYLYRNGNL